jgi:type IV secretory pathway TrbD component
MMRGTLRLTNKALLTPQLMAGAELRLVLLCGCFWVWVIGGLIPHLVTIPALLGFIANFYLLKYFAKLDPKGSEVFRANSRFLLQTKLFVARGSAGHIVSVKKVRTVPVSYFKEF